MTRSQLPLERALRALDRAGVLTSGAVAQLLRVTELEALLLLRSAEVSGLVGRTVDGEWVITPRGRHHACR